MAMESSTERYRLAMVVFALLLDQSGSARAATPCGPAASSPIDASYKLVFDDEFEGQSVDRQKWNVLSSNTMGGAYAKNEFVPGNATVSDGFLTLSATRGSPSGRPYSVGFIFTKQSFRYGYWEARARMPENGKGMWPAFWMNEAGHYPEIDVFEWLGNGPTQQWTSYHPVDDLALTKGLGLGAAQPGPDYSAAFHVYGMLWRPGCIAWYIDGKQVLELDQGQSYKGVEVNITAAPMSTILNSGVGGWNQNLVDDTTRFPANYVVDYVHIYSNDPTMAAVRPQPSTRPDHR